MRHNISRTEKLLLGLGAVGLLYFFTRSKVGEQAVTYSADWSGNATEWLESAAADIVDTAGAAMGFATRGERNNNPGNIRKSATVWQGQAPDQSGDKSFVIFSTAEAGIRALALILRNYFKLYGLNTVTQIISRWAPATENPTSEYISNVSDALGVNSNTPLDMNDPGTLERLTAAIINQENGRVSYPPQVISAGVDSIFT